MFNEPASRFVHTQLRPDRQITVSEPLPAVGRPRRTLRHRRHGLPGRRAAQRRLLRRYRRVEGRQRASWRFLCRTLIEQRHWDVLEQDRFMLEVMPTDADQRENLYRHDLGAVRLHRLCRAAADAWSTAGA